MKYFACLKGIAKRQYKNDIMKALETVHLSEKQGVKCKKLSGGMVWRLGIAQALLGNPKFLLYHACEAEIEDGYLFLIKGKERNSE